ncbi:MAG: DUF4386 domain-containing protein [Spirochaetota bacterium]
METTGKKSRILGLAFVIQFATSFSSGVFVLPAAIGVKSFGPAVSIGQIMANIAGNAGLVRLTVFMELITAVAVIFLSALLYTTVKKMSEGLALTAFGLYVLGGVFLAISKLILFVLLVFSREFSAAGSPASMEPMAGLMYETMEHSFRMANFAFCPGLTIFYALLWKAKTVPRLLSLWGLVSIQGVLVGVALRLFGVEAPVFLYVPYIPFELVIGFWILVKGINKEQVI